MLQTQALVQGPCWWQVGPIMPGPAVTRPPATMGTSLSGWSSFQGPKPPPPGRLRNNRLDLGLSA